jgi:hypothetical protein
VVLKASASNRRCRRLRFWRSIIVYDEAGATRILLRRRCKARKQNPADPQRIIDWEYQQIVRQFPITKLVKANRVSDVFADYFPELVGRIE